MHLDLSHQTQLWLGLAEKELHPYLLNLSNGIRSAVDVGSSVGSYTLYFLLCTEAQKIIAIEPDAACNDALRRNMELNVQINAESLEIVQAFAGFSNPPEQVSLDDYVDHLDYPTILKVDIEGDETTLLDNCPRLLGKNSRWIVEVHSLDAEQHCLDIFTSGDFNVKIVDKAWWRQIVPERRPSAHNRWIIAARNLL